MPPTSFRQSRIGSLLAQAGLIVLLGCLALFGTLWLRPSWFAGQDWLLLLPYIAVAGLALGVFGLRYWASFRAAENIADISSKAEARGTHPLVTLFFAAVFGFGMLAYWTTGTIGDPLKAIQTYREGGDILTLLVLTAPFTVMLIATAIMAYHRKDRPETLETARKTKAAEARNTKKLMWATPFIILVPYGIWVSVQPGIAPYVPEHRRASE